MQLALPRSGVVENTKYGGGAIYGQVFITKSLKLAEAGGSRNTSPSGEWGCDYDILGSD